MKATEYLSREHQIILQVLDCLEKAIQRYKLERLWSWGIAEHMVDFFREFTEGHHEKEEERMFRVLERRGFSAEVGPTAVVMFEHDQGRKLIHGLVQILEWGELENPKVLQHFLRDSQKYMTFLRRHIHQEEYCLFPMADKVLTPNDHESLLKEFQTVEKTPEEREAYEAHLNWADHWGEIFGVPRIHNENLKNMECECMGSPEKK